MTEEIIIDGVDVSGCTYYNPKNDTGKWCDLTCELDNTPAFRCERIKSCHYKRLKRLEDKCEVLEKKNAELEEALKEIKKISKIAFAVCDDDCGNANKFMDILNKINEVLKDE